MKGDNWNEENHPESRTPVGTLGDKWKEKNEERHLESRTPLGTQIKGNKSFKEGDPESLTPPIGTPEDKVKRDIRRAGHHQNTGRQMQGDK